MEFRLRKSATYERGCIRQFRGLVIQLILMHILIIPAIRFELDQSLK